MKYRRVLTIFLGLALLVPELSCKSSPVWDHTSQAILPVHMMIRRPLGYPAQPKAGPGGMDYRAQFPPQGNTDMQCEKPLSLFKEMDIEGIKACLESLNAAPPQTPVVYKLVLRDQPILKLVIEEEKTPPCLIEKLAQIPVPREIFYEAYDPELRRNPEEPSCFASGLDIYADERMGVKLPLAKAELVIGFPLKTKKDYEAKADPSTRASSSPVPSVSPSSAVEPALASALTLESTQAQLLSWAVAPFYRESIKGFVGRVVPEVICNRCLGEKRNQLHLGPEVETWPKPLSRPKPKIEDYERLKKGEAKKGSKP